MPKIDSNQNNKNNRNKFDFRLLDSQIFEPEKLAMEIPNPGDDFNVGEEVVNPYEDNVNNTNENEKKKR